MNIIHIANVYNRELGGGIDQVVRNLYRHPKLNQYSEVWFPSNKVNPENIEHDLNIIRMKTIGDEKYGLIINALIKKETRIKKGKPLIHQHGLWLLNSLLTLKYAKSGMATFIQPHGLLMPYSYRLNKIKKALSFHLIENKNIKLSKALIACSSDEANSLKVLFPDKPIAIIENGVPKEIVRKSNIIVKRDDSAKTIIVVSNITPVKGHERLIMAFSKVDPKLSKNWKIIIVGDGNQKYIKKILSLIHDYRLNSKVELLGPLYGDKLLYHLDQSDFFVLPSLSENYGIVVAEAMARGLPVLTTKATPWKIIERLNCGLYVDNSENALCKGLSYMMSISGIERARMGSRGHSYIKRQNTWDSIGEMYLELYLWGYGIGHKPSFVI